MNFGQFYNTDSLIHKLDPRLKIFIFMFLSVQIFFIKKFSAYIFILLILFFCIKISHVPIKLFFKSLKNISYIIIFTSILNIFFINQGNIIFKLFFIKITDYALSLILKMSLRLIILLFACSLVTFCTSISQLTNAFINILSPFKKFLPVNEIAMIFNITLRFIPVLSEEFNLILKAQKSRLINFDDKNIFRRAKNYLTILIPVFILAFKRADDLAIAMESRCYNPNAKRTTLNTLRFQKLDAYTIIFLFTLQIIYYFLF